MNNTLISKKESDIRFYTQNYVQIKNAICGKTGLLQSISQENLKDVFYMLCFCICVPLSKAILVDRAIKKLIDENFYEKPMSENEIISILVGKVRFHKIKAKRLLAIKQHFTSKIAPYLLSVQEKVNNIKEEQNSIDILKECRNWLVKNVNGLGMKAASHFMRNVGLRGLSILDSHILSCMFARKLISSAEYPKNQEEYLNIENIFLQYARCLNIRPEELDFLFWMQCTGYVFK